MKTASNLWVKKKKKNDAPTENESWSYQENLINVKYI